MPRRSRGTMGGAMVAAAVLCLAAAAPAPAQLAPLSMEARAGMGLPVGGFRDGPVAGGLGAAPTFGATLVTRNIHGWGVSLGFAQTRFECAEAGGGSGCAGAAGDDGYVATDVEVGGLRSFGTGRLVPWVRAGLTFGRTEYDVDASGAERRLSDLAAGASAGAGVATDALILGALFVVMGVGFLTFGLMIGREGWDAP
ncbi:MAG: hypothetical protein KY453_03905, partial [Gemmatimonadetes bacterium]|nr:hypothetical protein [Gemmatimonadota bacterium]